MLYDVASGRAMLLNASAASVWGMLGRLSVAELVEELAAAHEMDAADLHSDLLRVLEQLEDGGALAPR